MKGTEVLVEPNIFKQRTVKTRDDIGLRIINTVRKQKRTESDVNGLLRASVSQPQGVVLTIVSARFRNYQVTSVFFCFQSLFQVLSHGI